MNTEPAVAVKAIAANQGRELREIRLKALRDSPTAFLTTAADAEEKPDEYWAEMAALGAAGESWVTFLAYTDEDQSVGMVTIGADPERPGVMGLIQLWVEPAYRGKSVGSSLVDGAIRWAARRSDRVRLGVASDNHYAISLFERSGFVATGEEEPFPGHEGRSVRYYERRNE
jgi:ribosomal protein S18 acetylase RimI-like enzyme